MSEKDYSAIKATNVAAVDTTTDTFTEPQLERPVITKVVKKKRGLMERLVNVTVGPDGFKRIGNYIGHEIIIPTIKDLAANSLKTTIDMIFFKGVNGGYYSTQNFNYARTPTHNAGARQVNYANVYGKTQAQQFNNSPVEFMTDVNYYEFASIDEANNVLNYLRQYIDQFGQVPISEYYSTIGMESTYTDQTFGWIDLSVASVVRSRNGYVIRFPLTEQL